MLHWLGLFGRFELDPVSSGIDASQIGSRVADLYRIATSDMDGFLIDLRALVANDTGGFATYGAARLAWEMLSSECIQRPTALPLVDAGIDFKLARGLSAIHLTGYELQRLRERGDA